jgi:replicative DNA helicase
MASVQLITRLIRLKLVCLREIAYREAGKHEWEQLSTKVKNLEKAPLFIDDTPSLYF